MCISSQCVTVPRKKEVNNEEVSPYDKKSEQRKLRDWYSIMLYPETKAYLLFLRYILNIFSTFNAFFQSSKTRVYFLQSSSRKLHIQILRYVPKLTLLNHINEIKNIKFEEPNLVNINLGENCNAISKILLDGPKDLKSLEKQIESICHTFYKIAPQTIQKHLPYNDALFDKITHFDPAKICKERDYSVTLSSFDDIRKVATASNVEIVDIALHRRSKNRRSIRSFMHPSKYN